MVSADDSQDNRQLVEVEDGVQMTSSIAGDGRETKC